MKISKDQRFFFVDQAARCSHSAINFRHVCKTNEITTKGLLRPNRGCDAWSGAHLQMDDCVPTAVRTQSPRTQPCVANGLERNRLAWRPFGRSFKTNQIPYVNCNSETTFGPNSIQGVWLCSTQLSPAQLSSAQLSQAHRFTYRFFPLLANR